MPVASKATSGDKGKFETSVKGFMIGAVPDRGGRPTEGRAACKRHAIQRTHVGKIVSCLLVVAYLLESWGRPTSEATADCCASLVAVMMMEN